MLLLVLGIYVECCTLYLALRHRSRRTRFRFSGRASKMSGFGPGAQFAPDAQQQLVQLLQQQQAQQQQQQQQTIHSQPGLQSFSKPQQDFVNGLSAQQLQALLNQKNSSVQQAMPASPFSQNVMPQQQAQTSLSGMPGMANTNVPRLPVNNMNALLADMTSKAKAGMLTPQQLVQIRSIIEQQQSVQQPQTQPNVMLNAQYGGLLQPMQQQASLMMSNQTNPSLQQQALNAMSSQDNVQVKQTPNMAQSVQFVRTIQQRIRDVEQKLATVIPENERQALQRAHQELTRVLTALVQKISSQRGNVTPQTGSPRINMTPQTTQASQGLSNFNAMNFSNQAQNPMINLGQLGTNSPSISSQTFNPSLGAQPVQQSAPTNPVLSPSPEQFKRALTDLMNRHRKPFQGNPVVDGRELDLYHLFTVVQALGGSKAVTQKGTWTSVAVSLGMAPSKSPQLPVAAQKVAQVYRTFLELFEEVWSRAMLQQMPMNVKRSAENAMSNVPRTQTDLLTQAIPGNSLQNTTPRPSYNTVQGQQQYAQVPQQSSQPVNTAVRQDLPVTAEQLAQLNLKPEQLAQLLQQQKQQSAIPSVQSGSGTKIPLQNDSKQNWTALQQQQLVAQQAKQAKQASSVLPSPEKNQRARVKVTPKMLEDAEVVLKRIDTSLAGSRPKLPIIESMSETERTQVLEQIQKLASLKATVLALLPAFLAMTGSIEPAKRVKIMICMFDDQLALVPKRQCILRSNDLEKLKMQMTRCIGFVRVNDDKLAQQIVAKASQALAQRAAKLKQEESRRASSEVQQAKRAKVDDSNDGFEITGFSSTKPGSEIQKTVAKNVSTRTKPANSSSVEAQETNKADPKKALSPTTKSTESSSVKDSSELFAEAIKQAQTESDQERAQYEELAKKSPIEFVKKTWNELVAAGQQADKSKSMANHASPKHNYLDDFSVLTSGNTESLIFALINAPYEIAGDFQDALNMGVNEQDPQVKSSIPVNGNPHLGTDKGAFQVFDFTNASCFEDMK